MSTRKKQSQVSTYPVVASSELPPKKMGSLSELLSERMRLVARAQINMQNCVNGKRESLAHEARLAMPKQWAAESNMIGRITNIRSEHDEATADAVRHLVDGNIMGLHEVVTPAQQDDYVERIMTAEEVAPATPEPEQLEDGRLNPVAFEQQVSALAQPTDIARETFEQMAA